MERHDPIQGEGDYRSAREYRDGVQEFLEHADVEKAAREAEPRNPQEARELEQAEEKGRSRAKDRLQAGEPSTKRGIRLRPATAITVAGVLGYLVWWARRRRRGGVA